MMTPERRRGSAAWSTRAATRRRFAGLAAGLALSVSVAGPGRAQPSTPAASPAAGEWSFTDDAGKTVTLPQRPQRIIADLNAASALWDFGIEPVAVSGWTVGTDAAWGNIDRATPVINRDMAAPEPDLEKVLMADPDLFVTVVWGDEQTPYSWSFVEAESYEQTNTIVPVIGISATGSAAANTARFAELAELLGADPSSPELAVARALYDERVAEFSRLAEEKSGLTSIFQHASDNGVFIANPDDWADLAMYRNLGLNIVQPDAAPMTYWEELSTEQAAKYPADILFQSTRAGSYTVDALSEHPTLGTLPAVEAGQVAPWNQDFIQSYQGLAAALETMIAALQDAADVTE